MKCLVHNLLVNGCVQPDIDYESDQAKKMKCKDLISSRKFNPEDLMNIELNDPG